MNSLNFYENNYDLELKLDFSEHIEFDDRLSEDEPQICRFCGCVQSAQNTFNQVAHAIPNLLGNQNIISLNECDKCNALFGKTLETHLGNYFSLVKPLLNLKGKKSKTKFHDNNGVNIETKHNTNQMTVTFTKDDSVIFNEDTKTVEISATPYSYKLFLVYQAFMKMFYSILPKKYLKEAEFIKIILNINNDDFKKEHCCSPEKEQYYRQIERFIYAHASKTIKCFFPILPISEAWIFKRKEHVEDVHDFIFVLRVANIAFQLPIPTLRIFNITPKEMPSIFNYFSEHNIKQTIEDLSSLNSKKSQSKFTFSYTSKLDVTQQNNS